MKQRYEGLVGFLLGVAATAGKLCLFVLGWQIIVWIFKPSPIGLPSPIDVWFAFKQIFEVGFLDYSLWEHIWGSMVRLFWGYGLCLLLGIPTGILMGSVPFIRKIMVPFIALARPLPSFAWLALLVVWLGFGNASKIVVIVMATGTVMALGTMDGIMRVPDSFIDSARVFKLSSRRMFFFVMLPAASAQIISSARVSLTIAWAALIAVELVAAESGIGVIIIQSARFIRTDQTFAGLIILAIIGGSTDRLMATLQTSITGWARQ